MRHEKDFMLGGPAPGVPSVTVAQPFNDTQLVAMLAGWLMWDQGGEVKEAVAAAIELVAEAVVAMRAGKLASRVLALAAVREALEPERESDSRSDPDPRPETPEGDYWATS